jgi:hypothetical protein
VRRIFPHPMRAYSRNEYMGGNYRKAPGGDANVMSPEKFGRISLDFTPQEP